VKRDALTNALGAPFFLFVSISVSVGVKNAIATTAVQSERKPAGDKQKSDSPSSQLLTSANLFLRGGDLSSAASAALSASGQNASSPGTLSLYLKIILFPKETLT